MEFLAYYFGFLNRHRAATPVLIGSPRATSVGRRFMRIAGRFSRATGVHSLPRTQRSAVASRLLAWAVAQCCHVAALAQRLSSPSLALRGLAASRGLRLASFPVSPWAAILHSEKTALPFNPRANPALNLVRFALWTLRDKAEQRRLALLQGLPTKSSDTFPEQLRTARCTPLSLPDKPVLQTSCY